MYVTCPVFDDCRRVCDLQWGLGCKGDHGAGWGHALGNLLRNYWLTGVRVNKWLRIENDLPIHPQSAIP